jgi:magnesium chelatase subunit I
MPRICDLPHALPGMTGKVELVFEGEQEGPIKVSKALMGKAVREVFKRYFPDPLERRVKHQGETRQVEDAEYGKIISWFESGNKVEVADEMPIDRYFNELDKVKGLRELTKKHLKISESNKYELASAMEFVLDGLHQSSRIAKDEVDRMTSYKDLVGSIFTVKGRGLEEED